MRFAQTFAISAMLVALGAGPALGQAKKAPAGPGLTLTTAKYYTPSGRLIQRPWDGTFDEYLTYTLRDQDSQRPHDAKDLKAGLVKMSSDVPNYYVLSFHPTSLTPGLHALHLELKDRPQLELKSRSEYWIDNDTAQ